MVSTLVVALLTLGKSQGDGSFLAKNFPNPTGANGYEDYLHAADLARPEQWPVYENWLNYIHDPKGSGGKAESAPIIPSVPPGVTLEMTDLDVRREGNSRLDSVMVAIREGNGKPAHAPRFDYGFDAAYPEFIRFKLVAKIVANRAYVEFSAGRTGEAVSDLLEGIKFTKGIFGSIPVTGTISTNLMTGFLADFQRHLAQISLSDAVRIDTTCKVLIDAPDPDESIFRHEMELHVASLDKVIGKPSLILYGPQLDAFGNRLTTLNPAERQQLKSDVSKILADHFEVLKQRLEGPETGWLTNREGDDPNPALDDKSISNLAIVVATALQSTLMREQTIRDFAVARLRLKLLRLHAKVIAYHWQNYNWPTRIEEFADTKSAFDPFAGKPFHYELKDGAYRLYSSAVPSMGPIELASHRRLNQPNLSTQRP
jgi:hypothetical protein